MAADTCFVVEALVAGQPLHRPARAFLERIAEAESVLYFNEILELELRDSSVQIALKQRSTKHVRRRLHDRRERPRVVRVMERAVASWNEILDALRWVRVSLDEVSDLYPDLMKRFGLRSNDAVHAATALYADLRHLVTLDSDLAAVPEEYLDLLVDRGSLKRFRAFRARAART